MTRARWVAALAAVACGGGDDGPDAAPPTATVTIELENNTPIAARAWHAYNGNETPDSFAVKLLGVTLAGHEGESGPTDDTPLVYLHPACAELVTCAVTDIDDYLELLAPSAEVNAALAAPSYTVATGDYTFVRMHWARALDDGPNARYRMDTWQAGAHREFVWGDELESQVTPTAPLAVEAGADLRLSLPFNLDRMVLHNQSIDGCPAGVDPSCYSEGQDRWFIVGRPEFGARLR